MNQPARQRRCPDPGGDSQRPVQSRAACFDVEWVLRQVLVVRVQGWDHARGLKVHPQNGVAHRRDVPPPQRGQLADLAA